MLELSKRLGIIEGLIRPRMTRAVISRKYCEMTTTIGAPAYEMMAQAKTHRE